MMNNLPGCNNINNNYNNDNNNLAHISLIVV